MVAASLERSIVRSHARCSTGFDSLDLLWEKGRRKQIQSKLMFMLFFILFVLTISDYKSLFLLKIEMLTVPLARVNRY